MQSMQSVIDCESTQVVKIVVKFVFIDCHSFCSLA